MLGSTRRLPFRGWRVKEMQTVYNSWRLQRRGIIIYAAKRKEEGKKRKKKKPAIPLPVFTISNRSRERSCGFAATHETLFFFN